MQSNPPGVSDNPRLSPEPLDGAADGAAHDDLPEPSTLTEDISALLDSGRTYAEAEIAFQKTRVALVGKNAAKALGALIVALVLLQIALVALVVGMVIALAPLISIWGAIILVVGTLLLGVAILVWMALAKVRTVSAMFGPEDGT